MIGRRKATEGRESSDILGYVITRYYYILNRIHKQSLHHTNTLFSSFATLKIFRLLVEQ